MQFFTLMADGCTVALFQLRPATWFLLRHHVSDARIAYVRIVTGDEGRSGR